MQTIHDGENRIISYAFHSSIITEKRNRVTEKEAFAVF